MNLLIKNKKGDYEELEVKFSSFWGAWFLTYLATVGVFFGVFIVIGLIALGLE
jgi:hypothetical protein